MPLYTPDMEFLGSSVLAANGTSIGALTIPARESLLILVKILGFATADTPRLVFNSATATEYSTRMVFHANVSTAVITNSATNGTVAGHPLTAFSTTDALIAQIWVSNKTAAAEKGIVGQSFKPVAAAATALANFLASNIYGGYRNAAAITSVNVTTPTNNMTAGSSFWVFGRDV